MTSHMGTVAHFGPVGNEPAAVGRFVPRGNRCHVGRSVPVGTLLTPLGRFVPRGKPCHVGRSVPLTQHAMEESDDE